MTTFIEVLKEWMNEWKHSSFLCLLIIRSQRGSFSLFQTSLAHVCLVHWVRYPSGSMRGSVATSLTIFSSRTSSYSAASSSSSAAPRTPRTRHSMLDWPIRGEHAATRPITAHLARAEPHVPEGHVGEGEGGAGPGAGHGVGDLHPEARPDLVLGLGPGLDLAQPRAVLAGDLLHQVVHPGVAILGHVNIDTAAHRGVAPQLGLESVNITSAFRLFQTFYIHHVGRLLCPPLQHHVVREDGGQPELILTGARAALACGVCLSQTNLKNTKYFLGWVWNKKLRPNENMCCVMIAVHWLCILLSTTFLEIQHNTDDMRYLRHSPTHHCIVIQYMSECDAVRKVKYISIKETFIMIHIVLCCM